MIRQYFIRKRTCGLGPRPLFAALIVALAVICTMSGEAQALSLSDLIPGWVRAMAEEKPKALINSQTEYQNQAVEEKPKALINSQTEYQSQAEELHDIIGTMALELFANLEDPDPQVGVLADGIAMGTFVELKKLTRTSSFGRYLAEQLMAEFQQHGYNVIEARKSNSMLVQERRGEYGLSRNLDEIRRSIAARTMVTGTYTLAGDKIMVNAKVLDNKDATLLSSATTLFPKTGLADLLLADSASASPKKNVVTYMKRLEL